MADRVAIVGVGLIGASIGLALKKRGLAQRVIGIGRRQESLSVAADRGAIDEGHTGFGEVLADVDFVVVCTPVDRIVEDVRTCQKFLPPSAVVTDAGSTKSQIIHGLGSENDSGKASFVGSHPLAGSHKKGPQSGDGSLFEGRTCVVTPTPESNEEATKAVEAFWRSLGMHVLTMSAEEHDAIVARTSHLPHVASFALAASVEESDLALAATGFRDTTRLAASSPELWSVILRDNRTAVLDAIDRYLLRVQEIRSAMEKDDRALLEKLLGDAKRIRDSLGS